MGVVRGPREVDPAIRSDSDSWVAWARGPARERVEGEGDSPDAALPDFVKRMRVSGQAFSVDLPICLLDLVRRIPCAGRGCESSASGWETDGSRC